MPSPAELKLCNYSKKHIRIHTVFYECEASIALIVDDSLSSTKFFFQLALGPKIYGSVSSNISHIIGIYLTYMTPLSHIYDFRAPWS